MSQTNVEPAASVLLHMSIYCELVQTKYNLLTKFDRRVVYILQSITVIISNGDGVVQPCCLLSIIYLLQLT